MTLVVQLYGLHWNWYLIPFNPVPVVLLLTMKHRKAHARHIAKLYAVCGIVFLAFIPLAFAVTYQTDTALMLIVAAMAVRCFSRSFRERKLLVTNNHYV